MLNLINFQYREWVRATLHLYPSIRVRTAPPVSVRVRVRVIVLVLVLPYSVEVNILNVSLKYNTKSNHTQYSNNHSSVLADQTGKSQQNECLSLVNSRL